MYKPQTDHTFVALTAIKNYLISGKEVGPVTKNFAKELYSMRRACFVSLHKPDGSLRGCIGTIEPREKNLYLEISRNAISAAFNDNRFSPVTKDDLEEIEISVDILTVPELTVNLAELDPQIFGIIVTDGGHRRGLLLPSIPGIDTVEKQIAITKKKAGLSHFPNNELKIYRFTTTRYH